MAANVLIRKQKIRVRTSDEQMALQVRKLLNDTLMHDLTGMMERVFDRNAPSDLYINIDKLSIDLGSLSANDFEHEFIKLVEPQLINELQKQLRDYMEPVYAAAKEEYEFNDLTGINPPFLHLKSAAEQELTALIYFLEKGAYPWWFPIKEQKTPAEILDSLTKEGTENLVLKIISLQKTRPAEILNRIITRLLMYLPTTKYAAEIRILATLYNDTALSANAEAIIKNTGLLGTIFSVPEREVQKHLFRFLILHNDLATEHFMINFFKKIIADENLSVNTIRENQMIKPGSGPEFDRVLDTIIKNNGIELNQIPAIKQKEEAAKTNASKTGHQELDEAIYINNAGLLLLHPFLQYLFSDSGLLGESNHFVSAAAQHKAAVLLYFLQSGRADYKEWEMPFNKILCGMEHQDVLPDDIFLSETDKQNCDNLLKAVVNHWEALKGSGMEALRNTFLLREGKITHKESHWLIQVERTGTDILLDRLPWGYSTVKLPWLDQLILTEW